jgi:hypothetical protein
MKNEPMVYDHISAFYCHKQGYERVTFRKNGKAHRGFIFEGRLIASCHCPGSQNGRLTQHAAIIAQDWNLANCEN